MRGASPAPSSPAARATRGGPRTRTNARRIFSAGEGPRLDAKGGGGCKAGRPPPVCCVKWPNSPMEFGCNGALFQQHWWNEGVWLQVVTPPSSAGCNNPATGHENTHVLRGAPPPPQFGKSTQSSAPPWALRPRPRGRRGRALKGGSCVPKGGSPQGRVGRRRAGQGRGGTTRGLPAYPVNWTIAHINGAPVTT